MSEKTYYVAVSDFVVKSKLVHGDPRWRDFNASFKNYNMHPAALMACIYAGKAITTHHKNNWRVTKNYTAGQHIGLDFDNETKESTLAHLEQDSFIKKYASFVHTTISHQPDKPRSRAVFLLDEPIYQAKNYAKAAAALIWLYGSADKMCKDPVRFFYGAPGCEFKQINQVLPLSVVKSIIAKHQAAQESERKKPAHGRAYRPAADQEEVAAALQKIPPWGIDYEQWLNVLMAIHSEFGENGFMLAESWAEGEQGEVAAKWKSFNRSGNESGTISIGTLFSIAKEHGWQRTELLPVL